MKSTLFAAAVSVALLSHSPANAQGAEPYLGQALLVPYTYCPRDWMEANGQLLSISQYSALFSLYGTAYGGDGITSFGLPDLRGRVPVHVGTGAGLPTIDLGEVFGAASTKLSVQQMPAHSHALRASSGNADDQSPANALLATFAPTGAKIYSLDAADVTMSPAAIGPAGNGVPFDQFQPSLGLRYCVSLAGVYPPRN